MPRPVSKAPAYFRPVSTEVRPPSPNAGTFRAIDPRPPVVIEERPNSRGEIGQGVRRPRAVPLPVKPASLARGPVIVPADPETPVKVATAPRDTPGVINEPLGTYAITDAEGRPEEVAARLDAAAPAGTKPKSSWLLVALAVGAFLLMRKG